MKNTILILFTSILFLSSYAQEKPADFPFGPINSNARGIFGGDAGEGSGDSQHCGGSGICRSG